MNNSVTKDRSTPIIDRPLSLKPTRGLWQNPLFGFGTVIFLFLIILCFVGPHFYRASPYAIHITEIGHPPSRAFPLGGDELGRNELARLMLGGQLLILVGIASAVAATVGGTMAGLLAGFMGRGTDRLITWVTDVVLSVPQLVPLLLIDVLLRPSSSTMVFVVAATSWPLAARLVRAETLRLAESEYVTAARSLGASDWRIMWRHILPGLTSTLWVSSTSQVGTAVLVVATASFLGFGLPPPFPNWAGMIAASTQSIWSGYWWIMLFPGLAFVLLQLSVNFVGEALRESFGRKGVL